MLTEQRYQIILDLLKEKKSVTATELKEILDTSESTVRRDITALHKAGKLIKVFGGAVALEDEGTVSAYEPTVEQKSELYVKEKRKIAQYAAELIEEEDFIYLDAGTTTGYMIDALGYTNAVFVTNAVSHAQRLAAKGIKVFLIGGELKSSTEAVIGAQAMKNLQEYHFTKGFFGANGITKAEGFTTPDANEALVKQTAIERCKNRYILADHSKFGCISSVTFFCFCECKDSDRWLPGRVSGAGLCDRGGRKKFDLTLFLSVLVSCIDNKHAFSIVRIRTVYVVNILLASSRMYYSYRQCSLENVRSRNKSTRF